MTIPKDRCLHGFYAILDSGYVRDDQWVDTAIALMKGGASLLQIRSKGHSLDRIHEQVDRVLPLARTYEVPLIINDHLELALKFPGTGLHLGQDDGDIRAAREALGPDRILGLSTHSLEQARQALSSADLLDYFAVGPVFATNTKPDYRPVGLQLVREVNALRPALPFFCIGGINRKNLDQLLEMGAKGVVAVSDPLLDPDCEAATREYVNRLSFRSSA